MNRTVFPAEWEPQSAVQLTWPHERTDWAPILHEVTPCFVAIAREIVKRENSSDGLDPEKSIEPVNEGASFRGWSVRFTDPANGSVIYDSGDEIWDLYHPFDYYPSNPRNMHCVMTARWGEASFPQPGPEDTWRVVISYDLNGGKWPPEGALSPRTITGREERELRQWQSELEMRAFNVRTHAKKKSRD